GAGRRGGGGGGESRVVCPGGRSCRLVTALDGERVSSHRYPRTARLNELLHQIVAEEMERIDDERLDLVTVMHVVVEPDLRHATVFVDTPTGAERDEEVLTALSEHRIALQKAIAQQARV